MLEGFEQRREVVLVRLNHSGCFVDSQQRRGAGRKGSRGQGSPWLAKVRGDGSLDPCGTVELVKDREAWSAAVHGVAELDMTE